MLYENIKSMLSQLKLEGMQDAFNTAAIETGSTSGWWETIFLDCLKAEIAFRQTRPYRYRLSLAQLPQIKKFDDFKIEESPVKQGLLDQIKSCSFIDEHKNVLILGESGTGKTHLALAIAHQSLQKNYRIKFFRMNELAARLVDAQNHNYELRFIKQVSRFSLLVIDELGYVPIDPRSSGLLFELFSRFYEKGSIVITTHLAFNEWSNIFGSLKTTKAMIGRLTHHCHIMETGNESWRLKEVT